MLDSGQMERCFARNYVRHTFRRTTTAADDALIDALSAPSPAGPEAARAVRTDCIAPRVQDGERSREMKPAFNKTTRRQFLMGAGGLVLPLPLLPSLFPGNAQAQVVQESSKRYFVHTTTYHAVFASQFYGALQQLPPTESISNYAGFEIRKSESRGDGAGQRHVPEPDPSDQDGTAVAQGAGPDECDQRTGHDHRLWPQQRWARLAAAASTPPSIRCSPVRRSCFPVPRARRPSCATRSR